MSNPRHCELCEKETNWRTPRRYRCVCCGKLTCYSCARYGNVCKRCDHERAVASRRRQGLCICGCEKPVRKSCDSFCSKKCEDSYEAV